MAPQRRGRHERVRAAAAALPRPQPRHGSRAGLRVRLLPSRRSLAAGIALVALAAAAYAAARETSLFAVRRVDVVGAPPAVAAEIRRALEPFVGRSLVGLDGVALERRVEALPTVLAVRYDRAFPHTLRVFVAPERPVAVLRRGGEAWLVSARGRVVSRLPLHVQPSLPRIWVPSTTQVAAAGELLGPTAGGAAARALAVAQGFPVRIVTAVFTNESLVFGLRSGLALRLGDPADLRLKLAVARRALRALPAGSTYLDVSVPGRPVSGNAQLSGRG